MGGLVHRVPVHATVRKLLCSIVPQLTSTAGRGYIIVPGFQEILPIDEVVLLRLLKCLYNSVRALNRMGAIMARDSDILTVNHMETGEHRLVVRDTLGIAAFHKPYYGIRKRYGEFFHHLVVSYDIDYSRRGYKRYAVERLFREEDVSNLDDALVAETLGVKIVADGDSRVYVLYTENLYGLEKYRRGYMVNDGAVAKGSHGKFGF